MTETATRAHRTMAELEAALPSIEAAPREDGRLEMIIVRPAKGERQSVDRVAVSAARGLEGDHWSRGCWKSLPDGSPDPDVQVCMMSAPVIRAIAGGTQNWAPAGDNLFLDMYLSPDNLPPGTRVAIGSVEMVITPEPHNGCAAFAERFGRDACVFVNVGAGKRLRLRGIYGRVTRDGTIQVGDRLRKLPPL